MLVSHGDAKTPNRAVQPIPNISYLASTLLSVATITLDPVAAEAPVKVVCWICAQAIPAVCADRSALLVGLVDFVLQLRGAGVDELELRELRVEDADDLCKLSGVSIQIEKNVKMSAHTGSSGLPVLLSVWDVVLISSIMSVRSLFSSLRRSCSFSASL